MILTFKNQSNISPDNIHLLFTGTVNGNHCYFHPEKKIIFLHESIRSENYSVKLSELSVKNSDFMLKIPKIDSARIYISFYNSLKITATVDKKSIEPDPFDKNDLNYKTIYDKIEFTYNKSGIWINPTAVDFFSIPIEISLDEQKSGFSFSRKKTVAIIENTIDKYAVNKELWKKIFLYDNNNLLRIIAPGKTMLYYGDEYSDVKFTDKYLINSFFGVNYVDFLWNYYKDHKLTIDCSELNSSHCSIKLDNYIFTGNISNDKFVFKNQSKTYFVEIPRPCCSSCFFSAGSGNYCHENNTFVAIIIKYITSLFSVGLLPFHDDEQIIDKSFFDNIDKNKYYQENSLLPSNTGPWYDLYSKALHAATNHPVYTFAYDDLLGHDGTLHDNDPKNINITIKNMF